ncbi:transmembrane protein CCDC163 isoform X2 [Tenrec ecaudatus]|uniref:transmembrane protein CCDC163 isoform X2 n=1 Tax=Tenrec ecaudatus TaxID=94439 RepID=UPI003F59E2DD
MSRSLSWSEQLDELLDATDGNMAEIKQRLYPLGSSATDRPWTCPLVTPSAGDLAGTWTSPYFHPQSGVQPQQPWPLETLPTAPEGLSWAETHKPSSLWDEVTVLQSQFRSQAQVIEALKQAVQGLLEDREQKYQICALKASLKLLHGGQEKRFLLLEQRLETHRRELQDLRRKIQELAQPQALAQMQPGRHLLWEESEVLREELKLLRDQLSRHKELLLKQMTEGLQVQAQRWKVEKCCPRRCWDRGSGCLVGVQPPQDFHSCPPIQAAPDHHLRHVQFFI